MYALPGVFIAWSKLVNGEADEGCELREAVLLHRLLDFLPFLIGEADSGVVAWCGHERILHQVKPHASKIDLRPHCERSNL